MGASDDGDRGGGPLSRVLALWLAFTAALDAAIASWFYALGALNAARPCTVVAASLTIALALAAGIAQMELVVETIDLWVRTGDSSDRHAVQKYMEACRERRKDASRVASQVAWQRRGRDFFFC